MTNVFIIAVAALSLVFIWLLWLRAKLVSTLSAVNDQKKRLQNDLDARRDTVPLLLESVKRNTGGSDLLNKLVEARAHFHENASLQHEWEFEKMIFDFLGQAGHLKDIGFLEAKKDIHDLTVLIEKEKQALEATIENYSQQRKQFPYPLVSAIFGFRSVSL